MTPRYSSSAPYRVTNSHAGIGIGGNSSMMRRRGKAMPNASSRPNTPPDAPTVGTGAQVDAADHEQLRDGGADDAGR